MAEIGFKPHSARILRLKLATRPGTVEETITPHGHYLYEWSCFGKNDAVKCTVKSEYRLSDEEVESKVRTHAMEAPALFSRIVRLNGRNPDAVPLASLAEPFL